MNLRTAGTTALATALLLAAVAAARGPGGGGHGGGRPGFTPSYHPSVRPTSSPGTFRPGTFSPQGRSSFYSGTSRNAVSFSLRLQQNPFLAHNLFFFGRTSPFGLSGGWVRQPLFAYPWFALGYGLGYGYERQPYAANSFAYTPQYAAARPLFSAGPAAGGGTALGGPGPGYRLRPARRVRLPQRPVRAGRAPGGMPWWTGQTTAG